MMLNIQLGQQTPLFLWTVKAMLLSYMEHRKVILTIHGGILQHLYIFKPESTIEGKGQRITGLRVNGFFCPLFHNFP